MQTNVAVLSQVMMKMDRRRSRNSNSNRLQPLKHFDNSFSVLASRQISTRFISY